MPTLPDLSFPQVRYGKTEVPWDLRCLVYRGGAAINNRILAKCIASGSLGQPIQGRIPLVVELHDVLTGRLAAGGSRHSTRSSIRLLRTFFSWADENDVSISLESIQSDFSEWTEHLLKRVRLREIDAESVSGPASVVGSVIGEALQLRSGLFRKTRLSATYRDHRRRRKSEKLDLEKTFAFGRALFDIVESLTVRAIRSPLPIKIVFQGGVELEEWTRLRAQEKVKNLAPGVPDSWEKRWVIAQRTAWSDDTSLRTRRPLVNLRIEAELLIFIAQTGMNLAQAHSLKMGRFSYASYIDGYQVRRLYKDRRRGEVEFEIYSEYRPLFEAYLEWRNEMLGTQEGLLFPLSSPLGRADDKAPNFTAVRKRVALIGIPFVTPRSLRKSRVNWLKRRSRDDDLTAEMSQHTKQTLLANYDIPDHQVAMVEISRFQALTIAALEAAGPGVCEKVAPAPLAWSPSAPSPDCVSPAGCLFCVHQRDIDTFDHMWSLATFRYLKSLELTRYRPPEGSHASHPAAEAVEIITQKLLVFRNGNSARAGWIHEAIARVEEGHYHPKWDGFIQLMEIRK